MANLEILNPPEFTEEICKVDSEDFITAELENQIKGALLNNMIYLKKNLESYGFQDFLTQNSIGDTLDYNDLIASQKPVFFTNWRDNVNFPDLYGSGLLIPGLDPTNKYIVYVLGSNIYTKRLTGGQDHGWKKSISEEDQINASTLHGFTPADIIRIGGRHLAGQGPSGGYSFIGDSGEDTGMFSDSDGDLYFKQNGGRVEYIKTNASCNKNWIWQGQSGQPNWVWGGNDGDGTNMYVYNPSTFNVNYANIAGSVEWNNIQNKPISYAPNAHNHDNNYYTKTEINTKLNDKANCNNATFSGTTKVTNNTDYATPQVRNIQFGTEDLIAGSSYLASGAVYIQYE